MLIEPFDHPTISNRPRFAGETVASVSGEFSDWHSHDFGQLVSSSSGSMYVGTANRVLLLSPAMAIWIPPDALHWMRTGMNNEMLYVDVNREQAQELGTDCRVVAMTPLLNALMTATMPENEVTLSPDHRNGVHELLRLELISAKDVPLYLVLPQDKRIQEYAQKALADPAAFGSVDDWLGEAAASRKTIERLFISETGMPPARWLKNARILHAISQLAAGEKVGTVAFDLGYESASAFSYMFRKTIGVSPSYFLSQKSARRAEED